MISPLIFTRFAELSRTAARHPPKLAREVIAIVESTRERHLSDAQLAIGQ